MLGLRTATPADDPRRAAHSAGIRRGPSLDLPWLASQPGRRALCPGSTCHEDSLTLAHGSVASAAADSSGRTAGTWDPLARGRALSARSALRDGSLSLGRWARKLVPRPTALTTSMLPSCISTIDRAIARPSPLPEARASPTLVPR